ncbi:MAG: D-glycero-beta-D-manno-heptose 1-phosphate adenylyltransferase [Pseudopedobacter saltans]|uniref:D-glycero-beta-D-manno-heptose 1-phosphate adenylyltransferase n=1 Tax=Pseudopedobacter saltans TaxID=151895 RepID=A0A2W5FF19_9SPHI|nr:MAG: D-glycero-beta-D-manno-heptose 1-phosphate adenylyltransferase [Pseudopedobacter saltans]
MKNIKFPTSKIISHKQIGFLREIWRLQGKKVAFTNGCFDILHVGHIASLSKAAENADVLIVGINSDESTKRLKGESRPINGQKERALMLANMLIVDGVMIFEEDTPLEIINLVKPDVLVKGGDYTIDEVVGAKEVISWGGKVVINEIVPGFSTTGIVDKIQHL